VNINDGERIVSDVVRELEAAWNAADGEGFARLFAEDADFVNIRCKHFRTRDNIAQGHQSICNTIYKGSVVHYQASRVRAVAAGALLAQVKTTLKAPVARWPANPAHFLR
jgi:uncharacterized protein (TIGR02246 family)